MNILSKDFVISCAGKLNSIQHKLFVDYGLRQIKYMFDVDDVTKSKLPDGAVLVGLSQSFMRWAAIDEENKIRYGYFKGQTPEWSEAKDYSNVKDFDKLSDFEFIYDTFNLKDYELDSLTHVHRNYLEY